jgi:decaprenylphospho-beta-D-erythro-pentofuranosid-2-ulose 2-reductase
MSAPAYPWRRAIVVGASSGIGEVIARRLVASGCQVALVSRNADRLAEIAEEINAGTGDAPLARVYPHDVVCIHEVPALFSQITADLGGLDLIVYASGVMPALQADEYDIRKDVETIAVNFTGAVAWLNQAAPRFAQAKTGTIVGVSSVAADRGRRGYPVYGATKAAFDHYLEALRNRVGRRGVVVVAAKPGPVQTPMTRGRGKLKGIISADLCADLILAAARDKVEIAYIRL